MRLVDKQVILIHCKIAVELPYLCCCGPTKSIVLLGSYYFSSGRWVTLGFVVRRLGVRYASCMAYVVCDGMYLVVQIVVIVDRV